MNKFLKYFLITSAFLAGSGQILAAVNSFTPSYQWFRITDPFPGSQPPYIQNVEHFAVYTYANCSKDYTCIAYLVGTTFESEKNGSISFADGDCSPDGVTIPLAVVNGNITTPVPAIYNFGSCVISVTEDSAFDGYQMTVSVLNSK